MWVAVTSGSVFEAFELGDTIITRAAKFRLQMEFRNEPFNGKTYTSNWQIPTKHLPTALTLMKTTQPPDLFSRSVRKIFELPDAAPAEAIHALGPELEQALIETFVKFENLGYLVYSRAIPLHMADDLIGGLVRLTWRKCRGYIGQFRAATPTRPNLRMSRKRSSRPSANSMTRRM